MSTIIGYVLDMYGGGKIVTVKHEYISIGLYLRINFPVL